MTGSLRPDVLVVGIGNSDRADDGFGPAVANRLRGRKPLGVCICERRGDLLDLIQEWAGFAAVILVDAMAPISQPGRVHRLDLIRYPLPLSFSRSSTHGFGVAEAVELARSLDRLPRRLVAHLVEGARFDIGSSLSPAVAEAVDKVAERIVVELSRRLVAAKNE